jgi:hypothetical protein
MTVDGDTTHSASPATHTSTVVRPTGFLDIVPASATIGVGSLPHRDVDAAAEFSFEAFDVLTLPSLPRRCPAEAPIAQALVGAPGVTLGQYGTVAIDVSRLDPTAEVRTDFGSDRFAGFRSCLELAVRRGHTGPVKWQFVGPISVGVALRRGGAPPDVAFSMASRVVQSHLRSISARISVALPQAVQLVVIDEPFLDGLMAHDFPIAPDEAVDLLSSAMASVETSATVGVHVCGDVDVATLIASGPKVLSLPARASLVPYAGYLARFLDDGGTIAWGAVATEGPIGSAAGRTATRLEALWDQLVERGCDPVRLRRQSLISPQCGLGGHSTSVAERVCTTARAVSRAVHTA